MKKTPQQIQNLKDALVWWKTVPKKNVDLDSWRDDGTPPYSCNTIACFGGWCAVQPLLVAQGVYPDPFSGAPLMKDISLDRLVALNLFGDCRIFASSGCYPWQRSRKSLHREVTERIKMALRNPEQT